MPYYRVVLARGNRSEPIHSVVFDARDAADALLIAQHHDGAAELWKDDQYVCTLRRSGANGEVWVISGSGEGRPH